jgi:hypothetical protein
MTSSNSHVIYPNWIVAAGFLLILLVSCYFAFVPDWLMCRKARRMATHITNLLAGDHLQSHILREVESHLAEMWRHWQMDEVGKARYAFERAKEQYDLVLSWDRDRERRRA